MSDGAWHELMRPNLQRALIKAKRRELEVHYGARFGGNPGGLTPEAELAWLDDILAYERALAQAPVITVRAHAAVAELRPLAAIPAGQLAQAVAGLLARYASHGIDVLFFGEPDDREKYAYLAGILPGETFQPLAGYRVLFSYYTPAAAVALAVEFYVHGLFGKEEALLLADVANQPWWDSAGEPVPAQTVLDRLAIVWELMPPEIMPAITPLWSRIRGDQAIMRAIVRWSHPKTGAEQVQRTSFRLTLLEDGCWQVVGTGFLEDLATLLTGG